MTPADPLPPLIASLLLHAALGGFDTLVDHEWHARLSSTPGTGPELRLHAMRSALFSTLFGLAATADWHGRWAAVPLAVSLAEIGTTARDNVVEFRVRRLPALERTVHLLLLLNTGAYTMLLVQALGAEDDLAPAPLDPWRALLAIASVAALAQAIREGVAARRRLRSDAVAPGRPAEAAGPARAGPIR